MSVEALFGSVLVIAVTGSVIDNIIGRTGLEEWRRSVLTLWARMSEDDPGKLTGDLHVAIVQFFDWVYGPKMWSRRRLIRSAVSSYVGLAASVLILGFSGNADTLFWFFVAGSILNLFPDFISLAETRWILRHAKEASPVKVTALVVLDLIATTVIFGVFVTVTLTSIFVVYLFQPDPPVLEALNLVGLWPFLLTTYVTSFFWILFVGLFVSVRLARRMTSLTDVFLYHFTQTKRPASAISAILIVMLILVFAATKALALTP